MIWQENGHGSLTGPRNASERSHRRYASMTAGHTETDGQTDVETDAGTYRAVWQVLRAAGDAVDWPAIVHTADDLTCCVETATTQSSPCTDDPTMFNKRTRHETHFKARNVGRTASGQCGTACRQPCGCVTAAVAKTVSNGNWKLISSANEEHHPAPLRRSVTSMVQLCHCQEWLTYLLTYLLTSLLTRPWSRRQSHRSTSFNNKIVETSRQSKPPQRRRLANANKMQLYHHHHHHYDFWLHHYSV